MAGYETVLHPADGNFIVSVLIGWGGDAVRPAGPDPAYIDRQIDILTGLERGKVALRGNQSE
jgi:hypothetical protein